MRTVLCLCLCCVPCGLFAALLAHKRRFRWLAALYVAVQLPLSMGGQFLTVNQGGDDWRDYWAPRGLVEATTRNHTKRGRGSAELSWAGPQLWPLIALDNAIWHRAHESDLSK